MSTTDFVTAAVLAPAVGAAAFTIARTKVTAPFRDWAAKPYRRWEKADAQARAANPAVSVGKSSRVKASYWVSSLVGCPYCLSHWLSWAAVAVYRPRLVHQWLPLDLFASSWPIIAAAMLTAGLLAKAMKA